MYYAAKYDLIQNYKIRLSVVRQGHNCRIYVGVYSDRAEAEKAFNSFKDENVLETLKHIYFFNGDKVLIVDKLQAKYTRCSCSQSVPKDLMNQHLSSETHKMNEIKTPINSYDKPYTRQTPNHYCRACKKTYSFMYKTQHEKSKVHIRNMEKENENRHLILYE